VQLNANGQPRIAPGGRAEIGAANALITSVIGRAAGTDRPPHLFTTLARHRRLFRRWLRFAGALMPGGKLPRRDTELVILRVATNCDCEYERRHHEHIGRRAGLSDEDFARVDEGSAAAGWSEREAAMLEAVDELHADRTISDALWTRLRERFTDAELIELCMLVGHYEMLAMTINGLRIQPDELDGVRPPAFVRIAERRR
jgi:alkylhydroperoxidase family enzyme